MTTRQALRTVAAEEAAEDFASGTEFGPNALALTDEDYKELALDAPKTLVPRARAHLQRILDDLTTRKAAAEKRIALAGERVGERQAAAAHAYEVEKAAALAEHVAALEDAEADLEQLGACREAIDAAVSRLNRAA